MAIAGTWPAPSLYSWVSFFANETRGVDVLTFAPGYTGTGGTLRVTVGIDPTSAHAADMVQAVRNVVATINGLTPTTGNVVAGNVPGDHLDFESVALHEVGHALGLGHPNLDAASGVPRADRDHTRATKGPNDSFDLDPGGRHRRWNE